eukprot:4217838-Pyramimonas_sp.AAC.2
MGTSFGPLRRQANNMCDNTPFDIYASNHIYVQTCMHACKHTHIYIFLYLCLFSLSHSLSLPVFVPPPPLSLFISHSLSPNLRPAKEIKYLERAVQTWHDTDHFKDVRAKVSNGRSPSRPSLALLKGKGTLGPRGSPADDPLGKEKQIRRMVAVGIIQLPAAQPVPALVGIRGASAIIQAIVERGRKGATRRRDEEERRGERGVGAARGKGRGAGREGARREIENEIILLPGILTQTFG